MCQLISSSIYDRCFDPLFFVYCVSNFELWLYIFKGTWQTPISKLQYNTCGRRIKVFSALCCLIFLTTCLSALYLRLTTYSGWCVSSLLSMYLFSILLLFFSAGGAIFERFYHPKIMTTWLSFYARIWPHIWPLTDPEYTETRAQESAFWQLLCTRKV